MSYDLKSHQAAAYHQTVLRPAAHLTTTEARQGVTLGRMRYVLAISLMLAVIAMISVFVFV